MIEISVSWKKYLKTVQQTNSNEKNIKLNFDIPKAKQELEVLSIIHQKSGIR